MIEVQVYLNSQCWQNNKSAFGRVVKCPDCFCPDDFVKSVRSVFGNEIVVTFKYCQFMNFFNFLYDLFVFLTTNYSSMPESFKSRFPESKIVTGRIFFHDCYENNSMLHENFDDYE